MVWLAMPPQVEAQVIEWAQGVAETRDKRLETGDRARQIWGTYVLSLGSPVSCLSKEENGKRLPKSGASATVSFRPFEIHTIRVRRA